MSGASPADAKSLMRRALLERRRAAHCAQGPAAAVAVKDRILAALSAERKNIAGYWPLGDELDCRPALAALAAVGAHIALPVVAGQGQVLLFRTWREGDTLDQGPFGTLHPTPRAAVVS